MLNYKYISIHNNGVAYANTPVVYFEALVPEIALLFA